MFLFFSKLENKGQWAWEVGEARLLFDSFCLLRRHHSGFKLQREDDSRRGKCKYAIFRGVKKADMSYATVFFPSSVGIPSKPLGHASPA